MRAPPTEPLDRRSPVRPLDLLRRHLHDPDRVILRRALRVAVLVPILFAIVGFGLGQETVALFGSFAVFALLAMGDLGGPLPRRAGGYLVLTVVGAGLITLATALTPSVVAAALGMAVVGFAVHFVGVFGGYYAASGPALTLSFVLAVSLPTTRSPLPDRLAGWVVGGLVAVAGSVLLWPARERRALGAAMATACQALADALDALVTGGDPDRAVALAARARTAVDEAEARFRSTPYRPAGPSAHDAAIVAALHDLVWLDDLIDLIPASRAVAPVDARLLTATAGYLRLLAPSLSGTTTPPVAPEVARRDEHLQALLGEVRRLLRRPDGASLALARLDDYAFAPRVVSYATLSLGANVATVRGEDVRVAAGIAAVSPPRRSLRAAVGRAQTTARSHLRRDSVWFRDALRLGVGLGVAVAVALAGDLPHAFWVALGTLSVLRSNALSTGYTAVQSLVGTLGGFALAAALVSVTQHRWFLWVLLPIAVFLAGYTPSAVHFVVGQASFTVFVVVLFNLLEPQGWRTGLVRLQDVAIGAAVSVAVSLVFWPRGGSVRLRAATLDAVAASGRYVATAVARVLDAVSGSGSGRTGVDGPAAVEPAGRDALAAEQRAQETFIAYLTERGRRRLPRTLGRDLLAASLAVRLAGNALESLVLWAPETGTSTEPSTPPAGGPRQVATTLLTAEADDLAACLAAAGTAGAALDHDDVAALGRRDAAALATCLPGADGDVTPSLHMAWVAAWLRHLWQVALRVEPAAEAATAVVTSRRWWR